MKKSPSPLEEKGKIERPKVAYTQGTLIFMGANKLPIDQGKPPCMFLVPFQKKVLRMWSIAGITHFGR